MRVVVYGASGSGKSTFAHNLSQAKGWDFIELDLINWRPNWVDRNKSDLQGFIGDVTHAISQPTWVATGSYSSVRMMMWERATDVVFLDLPRHIIMTQVISRSVRRAASGEDSFPGCKEAWPRLLRADHPIRWAWGTINKRRVMFEQLRQMPQFAHLRFHHCRNRAQVAATLARFSVP